MSHSRELQIEGFSCICTGQLRQVAWHGERYDCVGKMLKSHPELLEAPYHETMAQLLLFLQRGQDWELILDIPDFRKQYKKALAACSKNLDLKQTCLADFGVFDVSTLQPPYKEYCHLIFFVCDTTTGVPYRAVFNESENETHYELLPRCG